MNIPHYIKEDLSDGKKYTLTEDVNYQYKHGKTIFIKKGTRSDGATGPALDIPSLSWWVHDIMIERGTWDNGDTITKTEEALVISKILMKEHRYFRSIYWGVSTFIYRLFFNS